MKFTYGVLSLQVKQVLGDLVPAVVDLIGSEQECKYVCKVGEEPILVKRVFDQRILLSLTWLSELSSHRCES